ncbi:hypothetical protein [Lentibacillus saliphilus]|uniref:hypothetical protein n=1 Tax=Lentibacillus saliphilus TaxID=2737028 RepID=UPI001C2F35DF|nr:hypothetical protein [Lentibacillus saliphilus]
MIINDQGGNRCGLILESLRFIVVFHILLVLIGGMTHYFLEIIGVDADTYWWTVIIAVLIVTFTLYKNRGWGKGYVNKSILLLSLALIVLLSLSIPDSAPTQLHTSISTYTYGFPFNFLTIYSADGTHFLFPNLLSGVTLSNISLNTAAIVSNVLIFYFCLRFIFRRLNIFCEDHKSVLK